MISIPSSPPPSFDSRPALLASARRFVGWLDRNGYASFDPYDVWGTRYGLWSRKVYYGNRRLGAPLVAPLVFLDVVCPGLRRLFVTRQRFATADAQLLLAFLNLYESTGEQAFLHRAKALGEEILGYAIPGYRGPCWGYPFDWQNSKGAVWAKNTPYITCTPYCYEAFLGLFTATGDTRYQDLAGRIAEFVHGDLRDTPTSPTAAAGSYSPLDNSKVINASAYRAWLLLDAGKRFGRDDYLKTGERNLNFVLESQRSDGAWLYAHDGTSSFIDHFHTCFNLKNLVKINQRLERDDIRETIRRGLNYYSANLFDENGDPKSFAVKPRMQLARLEMYNFGEGITLGALLADTSPIAAEIADRLSTRLINQQQLSDGHFVTRVFTGGIRHTFPFVRWPQAQLFLAITNWLKVVGNKR